MNAKYKLLPCPFCGSKEIDIASLKNRENCTAFAICKHCAAQGPIVFASRRTPGKAIDTWNERYIKSPGFCAENK